MPQGRTHRDREAGLPKRSASDPESECVPVGAKEEVVPQVPSDPSPIVVG